MDDKFRKKSFLPVSNEIFSGIVSVKGLLVMLGKVMEAEFTERKPVLSSKNWAPHEKYLQICFENTTIQFSFEGNTNIVFQV